MLLEFMKQISNDPNDTITRSVFCDWLEDNGMGEIAYDIRFETKYSIRRDCKDCKESTVEGLCIVCNRMIKLGVPEYIIRQPFYYETKNGLMSYVSLPIERLDVLNWLAYYMPLVGMQVNSLDVALVHGNETIDQWYISSRSPIGRFLERQANAFGHTVFVGDLVHGNTYPFVVDVLNDLSTMLIDMYRRRKETTRVYELRKFEANCPVYKNK